MLIGGAMAAGAARAGSDTITLSQTVNIRGTVVGDGTSLGAFTLGSSDPLVIDPALPEPGENPDGSNKPAIASDLLSFQDYVFAPTQSSAFVFQRQLINPYTLTSATTVSATAGEPQTAPLIIETDLPSVETQTVSFVIEGQTVEAYTPAFYDTTDFVSETFTFTPNSAGGVRYTGAIAFDDPVVADQIDDLTISGLVKKAEMGGVWGVEDSDSFVLRAPGSSMSGGLLATGKATDFSPGSIPEPEAWTLMLVGFAAAGAALRRRAGRSLGSAAAGA
jgi:hypothetical protein